MTIPESEMEEVAERYTECLYRMCFMMLGQHADAEDAVADTLVRCMTKAPFFQDGQYPFKIPGMRDDAPAHGVHDLPVLAPNAHAPIHLLGTDFKPVKGVPSLGMACCRKETHK